MVDTEKADIEVEVFEDGVVEELLVEPGVEVPVGTVLARIATGADVGGRPAASAVQRLRRRPVGRRAVRPCARLAPAPTRPLRPRLRRGRPEASASCGPRPWRAGGPRPAASTSPR